MGPEQMRLEQLFEKFFNKTASLEERAELAILVEEGSNNDKVMELLTKKWEGYQGDETIISTEKSAEILKVILGNSTKEVDFNTHKTRRIWWRVAAAAAILILLVGVYWIGSNKKSGKQTTLATNTVEDVKPGTYKARLTLADGRTIIIDSAAPGQLAVQGNTTVINKDGQLIYKSGKDNQSVSFNTISTNKGETYSFTLADGTKLWLNSGSSVYFPVSFPDKERRIEIKGEVYVKVAKNASKPFIASVSSPFGGGQEGAGMEVLALGTEFNINSYPDEENISTTLIEGLVKVTKGSAIATLKPGQQTKLNSNQQFAVVKNVNTDEITAWKDGWFHFESADLKTILRQFARWYDLEVIYEGPVKNRKFFCFMKRSSTLKYVLESLQDNDIVFRIEGKKLIVKSG